MRTHRFQFMGLFVFIGVLLAAQPLPAGDGDISLETGGVQITLSDGWESLQQPSNFFIQKRARHPQRGIAVSAGSFKLDLPVELYTAIGIGSLLNSPETQLDYLAKQVGLPREQVEKVLASQVGKQMVEQIKQASRTMRFEFISSARQKLERGTRFEIRSKITILDTGKTVYSRQFVLPGASPHEIVQITYAGASDDLFDQKDLADAIKPKPQSP